ncbi:MAG: response regulator [Gemmatimonadota bacterium]|nr:response regulator [Gemmatimonadota bacterium]
MTQPRKCILLVEDNPADAAVAIGALREFARTHEVIVVDDGADARDFLNAVGEFSHREACDTPDLVLLEMELPKMGGLELIKAMRSERRTRAVPVVVVTSSDEEGDVLGAYEMGANSYIRKPVNSDDFARAIREIIRYWLTVNRAPPKPPAEPQSGLRNL